MGLFRNIIDKITGKDLDSRSRSISNRLLRLHDFIQNQNIRLEKLKRSTIDIPWFEKFSRKSAVKVSKSFTPPTFSLKVTMLSLLEKRKREEAERIEKLKRQVDKSFSEIRDLLKSENVSHAENILYVVAAILNQIKDESYQTKFDKLKSDIELAKIRIRQRDTLSLLSQSEENERRNKIRLRRLEEKAEKERTEKESRAREYEEKLARGEYEHTLEIARLTELVTCQKENAQAFLNHLRFHNVKCFYHFTDERNLFSIRKFGGLCSWYYSTQNDINIANPGGDGLSRSLDSKQGLQDYVRLSFCSDHPMAYCLKQSGASLVLLKIDIQVAAFIDTQFSNVNATDNDNIHGKNLIDLQRVNIAATQRRFVSRKEGEIFHEHQAECMVRTFIPASFIINLDNPLKIW